jgi:hypothetical protein
MESIDTNSNDFPDDGQERFRQVVVLKGYFPEHKRDAMTGKSFVDLSGASYGQIAFICTDEEFSALYDEYIGYEETYYKCIGIHKYDLNGKELFK